ncbi:MAG: DUF2076 domain-containing protein [Xanthobacteraceae bacterium]
MTPQERELIVDLFERLAALEDQPRDPEAERAIREGLAKAPHALYPLVQSVLVQDEALKAADAHIQELEAALQGGPGGPEQPKGFLDSMRDTLFGRDEGRGREEARGSVPSVRPGDQPMGVPPQYRSGTGAPWGSGAPSGSMGPGGMGPGGMGPGGMGPGGMAPEPGRGGSFLGTAAAAAAGAIGGGLLLNGIRGMLGGQQHHGPFAGAFDEIASGGSRAPWGGGGGGELGREAGLDDIGRGGQGRAGLFDSPEQDAGHDRTAGLVDTDADSEFQDAELDDDVDGGSDDTDYA